MRADLSSRFSTVQITNYTILLVSFRQQVFKLENDGSSTTLTGKVLNGLRREREKEKERNEKIGEKH